MDSGIEKVTAMKSFILQMPPQEKMVWNYLEGGGLTSILIGIPQTFPPKPIRGIMVGSFLASDKSADRRRFGSIE